LGKIYFQIGNRTFVYEKSDEEVYEYLGLFTGGRVINPPNLNKEQKLVSTPTLSKQDILPSYYEPSEEQIEDFIKNNSDYNHGVRKIFAHFNGRDIQLDHEDKELSKIWNNIRIRSKRIRDKISNAENGYWEGNRVSKGKEYVFLKQDMSGNLVNTAV